MTTGLERLASDVQRDLSYLNEPAADWTPTPHDPAQLDVAIIGGGMTGLTVAFGLRRQGIRRVAIFDRNAAGQEGPWVSYARMTNLRSAKTATGPDLGIPSLTFHAWFAAQFGEAAWSDLGRIPRPLWMEYLRWFRRVLDITVENGTSVEAIERDAGCFRLSLATAAGHQTRTARRIVLATGRDGNGRKRIPPIMQGLPARFWAHSSDDIDFAALAGRRVAVLGGGASAFDNAAMALEAGAAQLDMYIRRPFLPQISKPKWMYFPGCRQGFPALDDAQRWHIVNYCATHQVPPPRDSVLRVARHAAYRLRAGEAWQSVEAQGDDVLVHTKAGVDRFDFLILGTGFEMDPALRPELAAITPHIALWQDRFTPPPGEANIELGRHPYLGPHAEFTELVPGTAPWVGHIHNLTHGTILSFGAINGDIPGLGDGARRVVSGIVESLFTEDFAHHYARLQALQDLELAGTAYAVFPPG